jgi:hypothetical protein
MKLPELDKPEKYVGLYIFDFGDHAGVGFTAEEVAELLESEKYNDGKVYKIHKAYPDGRLEIKGMPSETFQLEAGMFFYSSELEDARQDFKAMVNLAVKSSPPCRAMVHLAKYAYDKLVVALIYPAGFWTAIIRPAGLPKAGSERCRGIMTGSRRFWTSINCSANRKR